MNEIVNFIVNLVKDLGYLGIFLMMFLESSFFPFPSEVVMIPAGYLAFKGKMNLFLIILAGASGSLAGAWFNYILAKKYGRRFLLRIISRKKLKKLEDFFYNHGHISTFSGRLIPGIRQYISFPAGLAKMDKFLFSLYTTLGAGIWVTILALLGYYMGENEEIIQKYLKEITILVLIILTIVIMIYIKLKKETIKLQK